VPSQTPAIGSFAGLSLERTRIVGIINATPDSFSDGGEAFRAEDAITRGRCMLEEGADILDVGGESTRPGAVPVPVEEEMARVLPVVEALAAEGAIVSVDSRRAVVMKAALAVGARVTNDVTALTHDPDSIVVAADNGAHVILMHMQGEPGTMQDNPRYEDAAQEVHDFLVEQIMACEAANIPRVRIAVDPGIGFGKNLDHNLDILARLDLYRDIGCALMLGVSRKSFIGKITGEKDPKSCVPGSLASALAGVRQGARLLRVHDVAETRQALNVWEAIEKVRA